MKKLIHYLKTPLFGVVKKGQPISTPTPPTERPYDAKDFIRWCNEFKVSSNYGNRNQFY